MCVCVIILIIETKFTNAKKRWQYYDISIVK